MCRNFDPQEFFYMSLWANRIKKIASTYPILAALTPDNLRVGLTMYKALIRSVITYSAPAWGFAAVSHLRKLQVVQNQVIRLITHLPRVASRRKFHDELELPTIDEFIARLARNLYAEARANPNPAHIWPRPV
ncbi:hypothetical protein ANN_26533 [Periplaneta americana]|uniref:RNA-directed DNA polymerase from mobile element jockey n=1 Tax=Periplaneta americana TaxID=6978 RepID=A0ABQ8RYE4_PERAM|nr:hypothetical protein ANN_26533 [Periplaneta americana]